MKFSAWLQPFIIFLLPFILTIFVFKRYFATKTGNKNLPPSPPKLPIIGHLHKLGSLPHRPLLSLSTKYGPLMLLHLGSIPTLIVSSAVAAEEIMKTHDVKFADRIRTYANEKLLYCFKNVNMAPYGKYWRKMKSFCVVQLLNNKRVHDMGEIREEETSFLVKNIVESNSSVVDLSELLITLTNNVVCTAAFGIEEDSIGGFHFDRDSIKALLLDIIAGGTHTTYTALDWTMTELLRHPKAMKEVQNEVRNICRGKSNITYPDDMENMNYLKSVIKETLRLHPPAPLLVPRTARQDVKVMGYDIAAGTVVIINAWGIGRDPASWDEPDDFRPERFLNSTIDYTGHDFELIPFGAGRRCLLEM